MKHKAMLRAAVWLALFTPPALAQKLTDKGWPRTFTSGATSCAVYQPPNAF
jgi:hypothetical protein